MSDYPAALGQRPLEVREAYEALEAYAAAYGREPLLLMMHAAVPETLRADLLNLIKLNFLPGRGADLSMEADVLFSPLTTDLGDGYYRIDPQVRWHCLGLLRSLYRDDARSRQRRIAELLWRYVESMEHKAVRTANPLLTEFLDVQRWVALSFLEPANAAHAFAEALRNATENPASTILRLGGLTSAIELPLANEQELLAYARGVDALVTGDGERAQTILGRLGDDEILVGGIALRAPTELLKRHRRSTKAEERDGEKPEKPEPKKKTCFVIQGYGKKTDYTDGRVLDLDASYEVIKEAVQAAGLDCLRADEIAHSGTIDVPMYEQLLNADVVIADLSTYNLNAAYQLGVRFVLRPYITIVLAEDKFRNPFDLSHIVIRPYHHLGEEIGFREANRLKSELKAAIEQIVLDPKTDSPVYTYIPGLQPPIRGSHEDTKSLVKKNSLLDRQRRASCFVIQAFGKKTDYTDGRVLDLDASYEVIKEAVQAAGLDCLRADEIIHDGAIDLPMYEQLLNADIVIADLATYNVNAAYELGVRYALRPYSTLVLADDGFRNPFDLSHIVIRPYHHLGEDIGPREAKRLISELKAAIEQIMLNPQTDSPVYIYIPDLQPPTLNQQDMQASRSAANLETAAESNPGTKVMLDLALERIKQSDFSGARVLLEEVKKLRPIDSFVIQQLALATYKSKKPTAIDALHDARKILWELLPETSNNPETLGLWGAIHKRLWELENSSEYLNESIKAYERGFYLKQDYYNGINLAFLLNIRALEALKAGRRDDAIADSVLAGRIRKDVIRYTTPLVETTEESPIEDRYWIVATLWEASIGLGDEAAALKWESEAKAMPVADWMQETRENQGAKLREILRTYSGLITKENEIKH